MSKKILLPVYPSESFYDAVVATGDLLAREGGMVTILFTISRPPQSVYEAEGDGRPSDIDITEDAVGADARDIEGWHDLQIQALEEARGLLRERGVHRDRIEYVFADQADHESTAQAIADEAAAGAYDLVVLSRGYFEKGVDDSGSAPEEVASAIQALDEVGLLVT